MSVSPEREFTVPLMLGFTFVARFPFDDHKASCLMAPMTNGEATVQCET